MIWYCIYLFLLNLLAIELSMTYFAEPFYIEYDKWFDENIDPLDLIKLNEKEFSNTVHKKFYDISKRNLKIGSSDNFN